VREGGASEEDWDEEGEGNQGEIHDGETYVVPPERRQLVQSNEKSGRGHFCLLRSDVWRFSGVLSDEERVVT